MGRYSKEDEMKVTKIIHKAERANDEGYWLVWAQCSINGQYRCCTLIYDTFEEAKAVKEGQNLDIEKTRFSIRNYG